MKKLTKKQAKELKVEIRKGVRMHTKPVNFVLQLVFNAIDNNTFKHVEGDEDDE